MRSSTCAVQGFVARGLNTHGNPGRVRRPALRVERFGGPGFVEGVARFRVAADGFDVHPSGSEKPGANIASTAIAASRELVVHFVRQYHRRRR